MKQLPIGIFDSGIGGLTVMQELIKALPHESFVYFGDTARLPYGNKSPEAIVRFSLENASFLLEQQIKMLVVACNTASAYAMEKLLSVCSVPVVGVIAPGAERAVKESVSGKIVVLATKATVKSEAYQRAILKLNPAAEVISIPCPLFVPLVEEQFHHHPSARLIVQEYLSPIRKQEVDVILLGCTHYPLLRHLIQEEAGQKISIVDSALSCAQMVRRVLEENNLLSTQHRPYYQYFVSDDPSHFRKSGQAFLGRFISNVAKIPMQVEMPAMIGQ